MTFSDRYKPSIFLAFVWLLLLVIWCVSVLDMGESFYTFLYSLGAYVPLVVIIILRRPTKPTKFDLMVIKWGLPILFFLGLIFYPFVWRLRGAL